MSLKTKAKEVDGNYVLDGITIGRVTDLKPNEWFGKVMLSNVGEEFAEYGLLDPMAIVEGDDGVTYKDPKGGSDGSRGTLLEPDGTPSVNVSSFDNDEDFFKALGESKANEIGMHGSDGASFYDGKTFTCSHCGKVGDSFTDMAQEECPNNDRGGHQIPIFGDQLKSKRPTRADLGLEVSKANEDLNEDGGFNTDQDYYDPVGVRYSERAYDWLEEIIDSKAFDGTLESLKTLGKKAGFNETDKQWNNLLSDWKADGGWDKANENTGDFWWGKHVTWESGFDQDFLYCNYCKRDMYAPASYWEPLNYIGDDKMNKFIPDHLKQHGITEPTVTFAGLTESKKVNKRRRGF